MADDWPENIGYRVGFGGYVVPPEVADWVPGWARLWRRIRGEVTDGR